MSWYVGLDFQDGSGYVDITNFCLFDNLRRDRQLYNRDFGCVQSTCRFELKRGSGVMNQLLTAEDDVLAKITKDGYDWFTGFVRRNYSVKIRTQLEPVKVEFIDQSEQLKKRIDQTFAWGGYKVHTDADKDHSIIHQLLLLAGYSAGQIQPDDIDITIPYFVNVALDENITYFDKLEKLLFEFGYIFYHDAEGNFKTYNFLPASLSSVFTFQNGVAGTGNIVGQLQTKRNLTKYEGAEVVWYLLETLTNATIFNDSTGGTADMPCSIEVEAGAFYPLGSESGNVYSEYNIQDREIVYCDSTVLHLSGGGGIQSSEFTNYYKRAVLSIENTAGDTRTITTLKIVGRAVVKGDQHRERYYQVVDTEKLRKYTSEYITEQLDAQKLAVGLAQYDSYSPFEYKLRSREAVDLGAIVQLVETSAMGINNQCRVIAIIDYPFEGFSDYELEGVDEYSADDTVGEVVHRQPPAIQPALVSDMNSGVFSAIVNGFDSGGGTTTPSKVTIEECRGAYKANILKWDVQTYLTNLLRYEVQVSDDQSAWYELNLDAGADSWHGTVDSATFWTVPYLVHGNLPPAGTEAEPETYTLYYRVRRVTKNLDYGDWSDTASAEFSLIQTSDIPANVIDVNKVTAGFLNALIAQISQYIVIDEDSGYLGKSYTGDPISGDRRCFLTEDEIRVEQYNGTAWITVLRVGGTSEGDFYPYFQGRGVIHQNADVSDLAVGDQAPGDSYHFAFEDSYNDTSRAADPWTTKGAGLLFNSYHYKYGEYALGATSGSTSFITKDDAFGCNYAVNFGIDVWLNSVMQPADYTQVMKLEADNESGIMFYGESAELDYNPATGAARKLNESSIVTLRQLGNDSAEIVLEQVSDSTMVAIGSSIYSADIRTSNMKCERANDSTVIIYYVDYSTSQSSYLVLGTWNGSGFDFGTPELVESSAATKSLYETRAVNDSTFVILYSYSGLKIVRAFTIVGDTITIGAEYSTGAGVVAGTPSHVCRANNNEILILYGSTNNAARILLIDGSLNISAGGTCSPGYTRAVCALSDTSAIIAASGYLRAINTENSSATIVGSLVYAYGNTTYQIIKNNESSFYVSYLDADSSSQFAYGELTGSTIAINDGYPIFPTKYHFAYGDLVDMKAILYESSNKSSIIMWLYDINLTMEIKTGSARFTLNYPTINQSSIYETNIASSSYHHISFNYQQSTGNLWVTNNGVSAAFSIPASYRLAIKQALEIDVINNGGLEIYYDDLLIAPNYYLTPEASSAHFSSGNPWSYDIDPTKDLVIAPAAGGRVIFPFSTVFQGDVSFTSSIYHWHKIANPYKADDYIAEKTSGWTADRYTAASGGLEVDFSAHVSTGTKAVMCTILLATQAARCYVRPAGDSTYSTNTPDANAERFAIFCAAADRKQIVVWLNDAYKAEMAVSDTAADIYVSYPFMELR